MFPVNNPPAPQPPPPTLIPYPAPLPPPETTRYSTELTTILAIIGQLPLFLACRCELVVKIPDAETLLTVNFDDDIIPRKFLLDIYNTIKKLLNLMR